MGIKLRLHYGSRYLNLADTTYSADFVPPPASETPFMASGDGQNMSGGTLITTYSNDRVWDFSVRVTGTSAEDCKAKARSLGAFLALANDTTRKLYLEYTDTDAVTAEPLYGQGVIRWHIKHGSISLWQSYLLNNLRKMALMVPVEVTIAPYAEGLPEVVGSAYGGLFEDTLGQADKTPRGLCLPEGTTNKIPNPVFGNATYGATWAAAANIVISLDTTHSVWGLNSVQLISSGAGNTFLTSVTAGNVNKHTLTAWVMRPDGAAVTSADCNLYYNVGLATTYTLVGNGIYRIQAANIDGIAAATDTGLAVLTGHTIILLGIQFEEKAYGTPLCYGDMMGCSWATTAHASASTRLAGRLRLTVADVVSNACGSIRLAWIPDADNTRAGNRTFVQTDGATGLLAYFAAADDKIYFTDGTNTISSAALTFAAGSVQILHFVWGPGTLKVYQNGAQIATGATFTPPAVGTYFYLGSDTSGALQCCGLIAGFKTFAALLTVGEVLADYNNISPLAAAGRRIDAIPYLWNKDGDNVLDNHDDTGHDNYAAIGGIPGSVDALTKWYIQVSEDGKAAYWLMKSNSPEFVYPTAPQWYGELQGSADVTASGGEYKSMATAGGTVQDDACEIDTVRPDCVLNHSLHFFGRVAHSTGTGVFYIYPWVQFGVGTKIYGATKTIALTTAYKWWYVGSLSVPQSSIFDDAQKVLYYGWDMGSDASANGAIKADFGMVVNGNVAHIIGAPTFAWDRLIIEGRDIALASSTNSPLYPAQMFGEEISLSPGYVNMVWFVSGDHAEAHTLTDTGTMTKVIITPRWALL